MERSPLTESPPAMSPATENPEGRTFFRRESLSVAGARRSTMLASIAGGGVPTSTSPSTSPTAPRGIPRSLRNRRGSGLSGSIPSSASGGSVPRASTLGAFGVSFRNVFGGPDEETIIEGGSGSTPGSAASPRSAFSPRQSATMPSMPRRRRSSGVASYHWLSGGAGGETGDEPGVDVRSSRDQEAYGHMTGPSHVCVIDYSSDPDAEDTNVRVDFPGKKLGSWLDSSAGKRPMNDDGKPLGVRWIHVTGLNWEVVKTLTLRYQLHPLAVEDALRSGHSPRSKVDYYRTHMYLQLLVHHIHGTDKESIQRAAKGLDEGTTAPSACDRASYDGGSPDDAEPLTRSRWRFWDRNAGQIRLPEGVDEVFGPSVPGQVRQTKKRKNPLDNLPPEMDQNTTQRLVIDQLSASYMVPIRKGIISAFIMRDGMMITVCEHDMSEVLEPIYERLEDEHSLLRRSGDVSMLAHALLDVTADLTIEIAQAFEAEILKAESHVLVQAQLEFVRHLFIIQAQITRFRRQLTPLLYAAYIIRDQDTARAAAAGALSQGGRRGRGASTSTTLSNLAGPGGGGGNGGGGAGGAAGGPGGFGGGPTGGMSPHIGAGPVGLPNIHGWHGPNAGVPGFGIPGVAPASAMTAAGLAGGTGSGGGLGLGGVGTEGLSTAAQGGQGVPSAIPEGGRWTPTEEEMNRRGASSGPSRTNSGATTPQPHQSGSNGAGTNPTAAANAATAQAVMNCAPGQVPNGVTGYFSPLAKVYMNDVIDHLEMVVGASEQFVSTSDHLTDYVFNVLSFQTNNSMERLSIVTVIFLPLTFISSYFGMNFTDFVALENNVSYFWKVAAPCTIAFFVIFSFNYLQSAWDTLTRRIQRRQRERDIRAQVQLDG